MRVPFFLLLTGVACLLGAASAFAEDPPKTDKPAAPPAAPAPVPQRAVLPKEKEDLIRLFRDYLDVEGEYAYRHRQPLMDALKDMKSKGYDPLGDLDTLMDVIYASRPFQMGSTLPFEKKGLPKDAKFHQEARLTSVNIPPEAGATEPLRLSFSLPPSYPEPKQQNKFKPFPLIVTLHEKSDTGDAKGNKEWPGEEVIKRRFSTKGPLKVVTDEWIILAPVASGAKFAEDVDVGHGVMEAKVRSDLITVPLHSFWQRYQVDFDRIVLDGGFEALQLVAAQPIWFGGLIVRSGEKCDIEPALVKNFAHLPVYVVGSEECAVTKSLRAGGASPKVGGPEGLADWLKTVKRVTPKKFHWEVKDANRHILANWINVNEVTDAAASKTLDVEVLDTAEAPNTVKIDAVGVTRITVFLSDRVCDLNRPVRLLVNGQLAIPAAKFERNLDKMFEAPRLNIRKSQYYGWLYPIQVDNIVVPEKQAGSAAKPVTPKDDSPAPIPSDKEALEAKAKGYHDKAIDAEKNGNLDKALGLYEKIVSLGDTSYKAVAEAKVKELSEKKNAPEAPQTPTKPK